MNTKGVRSILAALDRKGQGVFTAGDLRAVLPASSPRAFSAYLRRLTEDGVLRRGLRLPQRGIYINPDARSVNFGHLTEEIAVVLRRGHVSYLSLESVLCEYGAISQIMVDRITVMTTGRRGVFRTCSGVIEFTHTARSAQAIRPILIHDDQRPLPFVRPPAALRDLRRVGRNTDMADMEKYRDILEEFGFSEDPNARPLN